MKTSAQVFTTQEVFNACFSTRHEEDLNTPKIELICLVISDFFKAEGPYKVKNKETFVFVCLFFFVQSWEADSRGIPSVLPIRMREKCYPQVCYIVIVTVITQLFYRKKCSSYLIDREIF